MGRALEMGVSLLRFPNVLGEEILSARVFTHSIAEASLRCDRDGDDRWLGQERLIPPGLGPRTLESRHLSFSVGFLDIRTSRAPFGDRTSHPLEK